MWRCHCRSHCRSSTGGAAARLLGALGLGALPTAPVLVIAMLVAGCHHAESEAPEVLPSVRVEPAAVGEVRPRLLIAGVLAPLPGRAVKVGALVQGRVERVLVAEGDRVEVGQILARIDARQLHDRLAQAEAQRRQASAAVIAGRARMKRAAQLHKDGIASSQEVEEARAALVAAESAYGQAKAEGSSAGVQLGRAVLRAPIAGLVSAILVPAGQPVDGGGVPVIELADLRQLDVRAAVPASRLGEVTIGMTAELHVDGAAVADGAIRGKVAAIAPLIDSATNTALVRVRIDNTSGRLRGGQFARGVLFGAPRHALTVPRSALLPGDGGEASVVAVVGESGRVAHRALVLGTDDGERVEVKSGLGAGERVIVVGGYSLPEGARVVIAGAARRAVGAVGAVGDPAPPPSASKAP